jgi:uncharacterized protein DUF1980
MSHSHAHGEAQGNYFLDQLFTILACGGIGLVAVLMYQTGMVSRILVPMFYVPVLIGGLAILAMAMVRAVAVWQLAGARAAAHNQDANEFSDEHGHSHSHGHDHSHSHGDHGHEHAHSHGECEDGNSHDEECGHDHAHSHAHAHSHDEGEDQHDHGWAPWRYMVLAVPIFLYFLGLPREGFSTKVVDRQTSHGSTQDPKRQALSLLAGGPVMTRVLRKATPDERTELTFKQLSAIAALPSQHEYYDGDIAILRGQFIRVNDREFTLMRVNRTCCVADEVILETRIVSPEPIQGIDQYQWVRVRGLISFEKNEKGKWIPVLSLNGNNDISTNVEPTTDANIP